MNSLTESNAGRRNFSVLRLVASVISTLLLGVSAFAQTTPLFTVNSPNPVQDFGRLNTGTLSPNKVITISNSGTASMTISTVALTGTNPGDYTLVSNTCAGATLSPNATCAATVRFNPLAVGTRTARLSFTDNAAGSPHRVLLSGVGLNPSIPNRQVGPIDPRHGFPLWYQDDQGLRLALCLDTNGMCLAEIPNPTLPPSVTDTNINFPGEAFWWSAEAEIESANGGRARLVLAKEAAFTTEDATVGNQISFSRVRIRIDELVPGASYTVTHPYGVVTLIADGDGLATLDAAVVDDGGAVVQASGSDDDGGEIDTTEDIGIGPSDFREALKGRFSTYLRWNPAVAPAAPTGYIGNPNVLHTVIGSPFNTNFFRVVGPSVGGPGVNTIQTTLFAVQGKIMPAPTKTTSSVLTASDLAVDGAEVVAEPR
ncbi:MAG TPA: choice-of-anchor D domain-containing protein [Pyrinomonadaceae bacterium]|nr:choice-of-anchor D domain-containing protein [Pyrinomonadaceae bacterium]